MPKIWTSEHDFVEVGADEQLTGELALRSTAAGGWAGWDYYLPDPDPVLKKMGKDITVYRELVSDAHVWSCYDSRKSGVLSLEWRIEDGKGASRTDQRIRDLIDEIMEPIDVYQAITEMLDAPFYGMSPIEVIWQKDARNWVPERLTGKPPEWFTFDGGNNLTFRSLENPLGGEPVPPRKFLLPRHHASYVNPFGERVLSRCFWPIAFKKGGFKFWSVFTEKFGMPWIVGKVPPRTNTTEREKLLTRLVAMVQDAVAVINADESIEMPESEKRGSADIYERLIFAGNSEVSKAILGQTLSTELGKSGSRAAAESHLKVRADLVGKDKRMVEGAFNTLFAWVTELNAGGATPPIFVFHEEEDVQIDRARRDEILSRQLKDRRLSNAYYVRAYNLDETDLEEIKQETTGGEFAENRDPDAVDAFTDRLDAESGSILDGLADQVRDLIDKAETLEEVRDGLIDLYGGMDTASMAALMQQALTAAELAGRYEVNNDE